MGQRVMKALPRAGLVLISGLLLLCGPAAPRAETRDKTMPQVEVREWRLGNGLRVVFAPHRQVPGVTVQVWYQVGSKDEQVGIRGMAHLFEHMMFKGSQRVPPEQHARMISGLGGTSNAFTAQDVTAYHNTVPRAHLEFAMGLEAERMRHLRLTEFTIASEREVVKEEKRMRLDNSPIGRALEAIHALAYTRHPYAWTPAGEIADLNRVTLEMCRRFYDTYYVPSNASLIVVGDVDEASVRAAAERQFGKFRRAPEPPRVTVVEPPQGELRRRLADWPSQLSVVLGAYHVVDAGSPDLPALKVLSAILSAGQSSRLNQALVRKGKLALAAGGFVQQQQQPGLFFIYAIGLPTHDLDRMKQTLLDEIARVGREEPEASELLKVRNQLATGALSSLRTMEGLASELGESIFLRGDPRAFLREAEELERVSAADVRRVAERYLRTSNLSLVLLRAGGAGEAPAAPAPGGAR